MASHQASVYPLTQHFSLPPTQPLHDLSPNFFIASHPTSSTALTQPLQDISTHFFMASQPNSSVSLKIWWPLPPNPPPAPTPTPLFSPPFLLNILICYLPPFKFSSPPFSSSLCGKQGEVMGSCILQDLTSALCIGRRGEGGERLRPNEMKRLRYKGKDFFCCNVRAVQEQLNILNKIQNLTVLNPELVLF